MFNDQRFKVSTRIVEQVKFEYSPLGKIYNKRLEEDDKENGILK